MDLMDHLDKKSLKESLPSFDVGDSVDVEVRITEGDKERIQVFSGMVIAMKGRGVARTFTVRRIVQGEGVERVFPIHSPRVAGVRVRRHGRVRRAKLYYLRGRTGKAARVAEKWQASGTAARKATAAQSEAAAAPGKATDAPA
ncbi:MAG: 50S ribosomal protein L19 [Planctomycetes bacterium]|nr:50S ribosomal protein L19 [Planctomycetota bacterium]